jgi:hypothetical protein
MERMPSGFEGRWRDTDGVREYLMKEPMTSFVVADHGIDLDSRNEK